MSAYVWKLRITKSCPGHDGSRRWCGLCGELPPENNDTECGRDCSCCVYDDGTVPADHRRNCPKLADGDCNCDAIPREEEKEA